MYPESMRGLPLPGKYICHSSRKLKCDQFTEKNLFEHTLCTHTLHVHMYMYDTWQGLTHMNFPKIISYCVGLIEHANALVVLIITANKLNQNNLSLHDCATMIID